MKTFLIVLGVIVLILLAIMAVLYFVGKKMQKRQEESQAQMQAASQTATILVIDKKRMKLKEAGLPKVVLENTPKYLRGSKVPIVNVAYVRRQNFSGFAREKRIKSRHQRYLHHGSKRAQRAGESGRKAWFLAESQIKSIEKDSVISKRLPEKRSHKTKGPR